MSKRIAVVTGASSGIGAATARTLAENGFEVIAAARRMDRLQELAKSPGIAPHHLDVTDQASVEKLAEAITTCDVLVNNAGGALGLDPLERSKLSDWQRMYDVNVLGSVRVTQALLPALRRSENADIVILSSTAAISAYEGGGGYVAAKHAEHTIAATLRLELCGEPIRVIEIAPGMVKTEEFSAVRFDGDVERAEAVYKDVEGPLVAEDVAECIRWALSVPFHVNIDSIVVRPRVQAAQHRLHKGPLRKPNAP